MNRESRVRSLDDSAQLANRFTKGPTLHCAPTVALDRTDGWSNVGRFEHESDVMPLHGAMLLCRTVSPTVGVRCPVNVSHARNVLL